MPVALSHFIFAQDCLLRRPELLSAAGAVGAGTQGPDPFAFYGRIPWRRRVAVDATRAVGNRLHAGDPEATYTELFRLADARGEPQRGRLRAFVLGLVLHYILDRKLHPYVYYRSGFDAQGHLSGEHLAAHNRFEAALGAALYARLRPGSAVPPPRSYLTADSAVIHDADALFSAAPTLAARPGAYRASWSDMVRVLRLLYDPRGIKKKLVPGLAGSLILPGANSSEAGGDSLNLAGKLWRYPGSGVPSTATAMDLYAEALDEGLTAVDALTGGSLTGIFDGRDHEGLLAGEKMVYKREK